MDIRLTINGKQFDVEVSPAETVLSILRSLGFHGVKFGDVQGLSGADTILLDGHPINAGSLLAAQAEGHQIVTIEALGEHPDQGWKKTGGLHPLQLAFIQSGAIQCGYCTPSQILAAKALLDKNLNPTENEVRQAIAGVLCRCTGYAKPVQAALCVPGLENELGAQRRGVPRHPGPGLSGLELGQLQSDPPADQDEENGDGNLDRFFHESNLLVRTASKASTARTASRT